jgi:serine phosphatase RsbU (regulator of sigma subunit)
MRPAHLLTLCRAPDIPHFLIRKNSPVERDNNLIRQQIQNLRRTPLVGIKYAYFRGAASLMGTNPAVELRPGKSLRAPTDFLARPSVQEISHSWATRCVTKTFAAVTSSPWWAFIVVILAIACVGYADSKAQDISLGYLYILPLSFSAILLSRSMTFALVAACIFLHDLVGPPINHIPSRILHNVDAFIGFICVVLILQLFVGQRNALNDLARRQRDELLKEVELAADVQRMFLPHFAPDAAGFEIAGAMHPARVVGGDYFDYVARPDGHLRLVIADVSGKGVAAALLMSATAAAVRLETNEPRKLCEVAKHLNDELFALQDDGRFVTVLLGELDPHSRRLKFINCGHNPALLLHRDRSDVQWLRASCTPLGLSAELNCILEEVALEPSDILVCYTDGVTEASDASGQEFGTERLLNVARQHFSSTAREICDQIYRSVAAFTRRDSLDDDLTVMVVKLKEDPESLDFPAFPD